MKVELSVIVKNEKSESPLCKLDITAMIDAETRKLLEHLVPLLDELNKRKSEPEKNTD